MAAIDNTKRSESAFNATFELTKASKLKRTHLHNNDAVLQLQLPPVKLLQLLSRLQLQNRDGDSHQKAAEENQNAAD
jgi:hypothetical protein